MAKGQSLSAFERELEAVFGPAREGAQQAAGEVPDLLEFIPQVSPKFEAPRHLGPIAGLLERARTEGNVRAVISLPPRHAKTETLLHGLAWFLANNPAFQLAYLSSTAALARKKSLRAKTLTAKAGVQLSRESASKSDWRTTAEQGGLWACGIGGQINGEGFNLIVVDDPHKGRAEAESPIIRDRVHDWLVADAFPRLEPNGSIIVCHTRWHPDDLIGRLVMKGWEEYCLPALTPGGVPLWPERWSLQQLLRIQAELGGPQGYDWISLYQGQPQPDGMAVFQGCHQYDVRPLLPLARIVIGIDFAYAAKTSADYSVAVVMAELMGVYFVLEVRRLQVEPRAFMAEVKTLCDLYPTATVAAYAAATEMGGIEFFRESGIPITAQRATIDKKSRSIPTAAAWNTGLIKVPNPENIDAPWLGKFLSEVKGFTGKADRHDDQVDALAAAYDTLRIHDVDWDYLGKLATAWPEPLSF